MTAFKKYYLDTLKYRFFKVTGRATRAEYWYFALFVLLMLWGLTFILGLVFPLFGLQDFIPYPIGLIFVLHLIPALFAQIRRLHDTGHSGWWIFLSLIPIIGGIILLVWYLSPSEPNTNKWGPDPTSTF